MTRKSFAFMTAFLVACVLVSTRIPAAAQATPPAPVSPAPTSPPLTPLKVQLVVARYAGEKKVSSLPYVLWVSANDRMATSLRMGVDVPVTSTVIGTAAMQSYSYRTVGTNIDCSATSVGSTFNLNITLSDSSIQFDPKQASSLPKAGIADAPAFRNFTSKFSILLRDGQTAQYTSATDPVSGEVLKVDVTLNVLK